MLVNIWLTGNGVGKGDGRREKNRRGSEERH